MIVWPQVSAQHAQHRQSSTLTGCRQQLVVAQRHRRQIAAARLLLAPLLHHCLLSACFCGTDLQHWLSRCGVRIDFDSVCLQGEEEESDMSAPEIVTHHRGGHRRPQPRRLAVPYDLLPHQKGHRTVHRGIPEHFSEAALRMEPHEDEEDSGASEADLLCSEVLSESHDEGSDVGSDELYVRRHHRIPQVCHNLMYPFAAAMHSMRQCPHFAELTRHDHVNTMLLRPSRCVQYTGMYGPECNPHQFGGSQPSAASMSASVNGTLNVPLAMTATMSALVCGLVLLLVLKLREG